MLEFLVVIICLVLNSFFAAFEMAFVSVTKEDFSDSPDIFKSYIDRILKLKKNPERTLSVIQIGITLVGAISAAVGGNGAIEAFSPILQKQLAVSETIAEAISVVAVILPLTYLSVVFGELVPKTIALNNPRPILFFGINFLGILDKIFSPLISILEHSTSFVLKILKITQSGEEVDNQSSVTISYLPVFHQRFVVNLIELHNKKAIDAMVKWESVVKINFLDDDLMVENLIKLSNHTRFPVIDGDVIVGILHSKELYNEKRNKNQPWQSIIRGVQHFKSNEKLLNIFIKLQEKRQHLAIINDKEDEFLGIITLEDIIEEIVGDIHDEVEESPTLKMFLARSRIPFKTK